MVGRPRFELRTGDGFAIEAEQLRRRLQAEEDERIAMHRMVTAERLQRRARKESRGVAAIPPISNELYGRLGSLQTDALRKRLQRLEAKNTEYREKREAEHDLLPVQSEERGLPGVGHAAYTLGVDGGLVLPLPKFHAQ